MRQVTATAWLLLLRRSSGGKLLTNVSSVGARPTFTSSIGRRIQRSVPDNPTIVSVGSGDDRSPSLMCSVPRPRQVRHPDVSSMFTQVEDNPVTCNRDRRCAEVQVLPRESSAVEVLNAHRRAGRPLRVRIQTL